MIIEKLVKAFRDNFQMFNSGNAVPAISEVGKKTNYQGKRTGETKGHLTLVTTQSGVDRWMNLEPDPEKNDLIDRPEEVKEKYLSGMNQTLQQNNKRPQDLEPWETTPQAYDVRKIRESIYSGEIDNTTHADQVEKALLEGKPVDPEIWKAYDDMKDRERIRKLIVYTSPEFLSWFGNWRDDPWGTESSKVLKSNGTPAETEPQKVYHGTPNAGFGKFSTNTIVRGDYGSGFYFTESYDSAREYAYKSWEKNNEYVDTPIGFSFNKKYLENIDKIQSEQAFENISKKLLRADYGKALDCLEDAIKSATDDKTGEIIAGDLFDYYRNTISLYHHGTEVDQPDPEENEVIKMFAEELTKLDDKLSVRYSRRGVYEAYLCIKNPFDMNQKNLPPSVINPILQRINFSGNIDLGHLISACRNSESIISGLKESGISVNKNKLQNLNMEALTRIKQLIKDNTDNPIFRNSGSFDISWAEMYNILSNGGRNTDFMDAFTESIKAMGFDGIAYNEGWSAQKEPHKVWIAFEPNQIKSTSNNGKFSTNNDNIYKSL
ncbi:hypothetical protein MASR1M107_05650 [Ignavibacteriales bacterium]